MSILQNIPFAIFNNIVLLGLLWVVYQLIENYSNISARKLFTIASSFQLFASCYFIYALFVKQQLLVLTFDNVSAYFIPYSFDHFSFNNNATLFALIGILYCLALLFFMTKFALQLHALNMLKHAANPDASLLLKDILTEISFAIPANIKLAFSDKVAGPVVFGYFEPVILMPFSICSQLSANEVKLILLHELAHIVRNDYFINLFIAASKMILWFNPFAYFMCNSIQLQREIACDDFVIANTNQPLQYTKALYTISSAGINLQTLSLAAISSKGQLLYRVQKMNGIKNKVVKSASLFFVCIGLLFAMVALQFSHPTTLAIAAQNTSNFTVKKSNKIQVAPLAKIALPKEKASYNKFAQAVKEDNTSLINNVESTLNQAKDLSYNDLLNQTKDWIKQHENPVQMANYIFSDLDENEYISKDSAYSIIADKLLMGSIIKSYQLKKAILEKRLEKANNLNEANDFLYNSKEWDEMVQYEKWANEFMKRKN